VSACDLCARISNHDEAQHFAHWLNNQFAASITVCSESVTEEVVGKHDLVIFLSFSGELFFDQELLDLKQGTVFGKPFLFFAKDEVADRLMNKLKPRRYRNLSEIKDYLKEAFESVRNGLVSV
jgi:hypothetical protein